MTARPKPRLDSDEPEQTRVCEIRRIPNAEHMMKCRLAIERRNHEARAPAWSEHAVSFRVTGAAKIRRVK